MIIFAVEKNYWVYVYNEEGECIFQVNGHLRNYSEHFVAVAKIDDDTKIDVYDAAGKKIFSYPKIKGDLDDIVL